MSEKIDDTTPTVRVLNMLAQEHPGYMPLNAVVIAEMMDGDGRRCLVRMTTEGMTKWLEAGMIESARVDAAAALWPDRDDG